MADRISAARPPVTCAPPFTVFLLETALKQNTQTIGWGVIGLGRLATEQIAPVIAASANGKLVGCAGSTPEKTRAFAQAFGVPGVYDSIESLAADPGIDAIFISTPNAMHHAMTLVAARAGKHVLCEKPLALEVQHGREMVAACRDAGIVFRVAFQMRLEGILRRVREIVSAGTLGTLRVIQLERTAPIRPRSPWRNEPQQGGVLFDVAVHLLDLVEWVGGARLRELSAYSNPDRRAQAADDTISVLGVLDNGCHASVRASREIPHSESNLLIEGSDGMLVTSALRFSDEYVLRVKTNSGTTEERFTPTPTYRRQIEAFEQEINGGPGVLAAGEDGLRSIEVASAIIESIVSRRSVATPSSLPS